MKASREEALRALNEPVTAWGQGEVVYERAPSANVYSVRLDAADDMWVVEEADRRGVNPLVLIKSLVSQARQAANSSPADQDAGDPNPGLIGE